jgi:hypothetical protein
MGSLVNPRWLSGLVGLIVTPIIALNLFLLFRLFAG